MGRPDGVPQAVHGSILKVPLRVAVGKTNRDIAHALPRGGGTVHNSVSNLLNKLDVYNRSEAAQHNLEDAL
ncbi:MAG: LuxR C-terminal-related transcriptional regulator [Anaerolineales bacterium]